MVKEKKDLVACLKEAKARHKIAESDLKCIETENGQLNQEIMDLKEELSSEKRALEAARRERANFEVQKRGSAEGGRNLQGFW